MSSSISWPVSSSLLSPSSLSCYLFLFCLFSLPCASLIWTVVIRFRVCSDNPRWSHLKMKWFISAKLLFPNKIIYRQLPGIQRWPTHWGVTIKTTTILWLVSPPINLLSQQIVLWGSCSVTQLCPTLCNPMDCSLPDSSVHGILQARTLEWGAMPSSRGSSWPRDQTHISCVSCTDRWILYL